MGFHRIQAFCGGRFARMRHSVRSAGFRASGGKGSTMRALTILSAAIAVAALGACSGNTGGAPPTGTVAEGVGSVRKVPTSDNPYTLFETLQVRPLALSADGSLLFAANTPDNRLEVFRVHRGGLQPVGSVVVGLEPVAVAARTDDEVWVVNHLSDSVSIVARGRRRARRGSSARCSWATSRATSSSPARTRAARSSPPRTAGRTRPTIRTSSTRPVGRADVWVFDANNLGTAPAAARLAKITLFADTPRALAVSADGKTVYAAAFFSGNQTTVVSEDAVDQVVRRRACPGRRRINLRRAA